MGGRGLVSGEYILGAFWRQSSPPPPSSSTAPCVPKSESIPFQLNLTGPDKPWLAEGEHAARWPKKTVDRREVKCDGATEEAWAHQIFTIKSSDLCLCKFLFKKVPTASACRDSPPRPCSFTRAGISLLRGLWLPMQILLLCKWLSAGHSRCFSLPVSEGGQEAPYKGREHLTLTLALRGLRQKDHRKFKASLNCLVSPDLRGKRGNGESNYDH